ncbi:hypothetical protein [Nocardioides terrigena]|uniref:hypothetical protein n=1 Tax=Nocardioides terrigena TaxID=424797 RepID=UPI00131ED1B5|nr:hypothetical protein [Nocardioides terrigena]
MNAHVSRVVCRAAVGALAATLMVWLPPSAHAERVKPHLFGIDLIQLSAPAAPLVSTPTARLIVNWANVERSPGQLDWSKLDARIDMARQHGSKPLLTLFGTPAFYGVGESGVPSLLRPPRLSAYRTFVRALAERYGARADYQVFAEMNCPCNYIGTPRHMAKMTRVAALEVRRHAPGAEVVAPHGPIRYSSNRAWFREYWSERVGGKPVAELVDVASLSGFPRARIGPEKGIKLVKWLRRMTSQYGFSGPIWIVEINYDVNGGRATVPISVDQQVANVVKTYVLNASIGTERVYWHYWSPPTPNMNTAMLTPDNQLAAPGRAFGVIQPWLIDTRAAGCTITKGDLYTCLFITKKAERRVIWSMSGRERRVVVPDRTRRLFSPDGTVRDISSRGRVRVGLVPVMIESRREPSRGKGNDPRR